MRERVRYGEVDRRDFGFGDFGFGDVRFSEFDDGRADRRAAGRRSAWRLRPWRRAAGPRPVRPGVVPVAVRPAEAPRPAGPTGRSITGQRWDGRPGLRLLERRSGAAPARCAARYRVRRAVAGVTLLAVAAAVVVLGILVRPAEPASAPAVSGATVAGEASGAARAPAAVVVTAEPGETVWEVADRVAPGLSGPRRAALAERIVVDNALPSARVRPGQVLRVATG
jgi:hypothetical protein